MEMHELQQAWGQLESRLEQQGRQLDRLHRQRGVDAVRSRLRWLSLGQLVELLVGLAIVLWAGGYWYDHREHAHLVVYGLALHAYGLGLLCFAVTQLLWLASINYDAPVLTVQGKLHRLAQLRVCSGRVMLAAGMVAWVPLLLVVLRGFGLDLWLTQPGVVWANLGVGIAIAAGLEWSQRRHPERWGREHIGGLLARSRRELEELAGPQDP